MKIGFLGNTNNYPFMLAMGLKKLGHEVQFVVTSKDMLHRPEAMDEAFVETYPDWMLDVAPYKFMIYPLLFWKRRKIVNHFKDCDFLVLNCEGPAHLHLIDKPAFIAITGSDLSWLADYKTVDLVKKGITRFPRFFVKFVYGLIYKHFIRWQRDGFRQAFAVNYFPPGVLPAGEELLKELGITADQRSSFMLSNTLYLKREPDPKNETVTLFSGTRISYDADPDSPLDALDNKRSDVMIKGAAMFIKETGIPLKIGLVKKGPNVGDLIKLIEDEGITEHVDWADQMPLTDLWQRMRAADIVVEQLGDSIISMAGLDAMALGRPVIGNHRPEILNDLHDVESPVCQAKTPEEVCAQLKRLVPDAKKRSKIGDASRAYVEAVFSAQHAVKIILSQYEKLVLKK